MIVFNGEILDTYENTLKGLVVKKSLASINNLSDRKGTASTEFDLPRTARNELIFSNISVEGAQAQVIGDCSILIDNNIYTQGKLYVKGYNDNSYKALFMGAELDLLAELKRKKLSDVFGYDTWSSYLDVTIRNAITGGTADGIRYFANMPNRNVQYDRDSLGFFFSVKDVLTSILSDYNVVSQINQTDYIDHVYFGSYDGQKKAVNAYTGVNFVPASNVSYINYGNDVTGNAAIISKTIQRTVDKLTMSMDINYSAGDEVDSTFIYVDIFRGTDVIFTNKVFSSISRLVEGVNKFEFNLTEKQLLLGDEIKLRCEINTKTGATFPLSNFVLNISNVNITVDNIQTGDAISFRDFLPDISQYQFIKNFLTHFNCVLDIIGDDIYIDLQANGIEPNKAPVNLLNGISSNIVDITDKVRDIKDVSIDYLQADLIELKQKYIESDYVKQFNTLPNRDFGSYLYELNSFQKNVVSTLESGFSTSYDTADAIFSILGTGGVASFVLPAVPNWDNLLIHKGEINNPGDNPIVTYNDTFTRNYVNSDTSTTSVTVFATVGAIGRFSYIADFLFINTLNERKSNKIRSINLYDHTGALMDFRNKYIIENQVYKLLEYQYDIQTKAVNAKIQLI
jgi:hypothetical protein